MSNKNISYQIDFFTRNIVDDLQWRVENSEWWISNNGSGKYDAEKLRQVRWLENAIAIYVKALQVLW